MPVSVLCHHQSLHHGRDHSRSRFCKLPILPVTQMSEQMHPCLKKPSWCFCPQMWKEFLWFLCFRRWGVCQIGGDCAFYTNSRRTVCTDVFWYLCGLCLCSLRESLCLFPYLNLTFDVHFLSTGKGESCNLHCSLHLARLQTHLMAWHKIKNNFHICMGKTTISEQILLSAHLIMHSAHLSNH